MGRPYMPKPGFSICQRGLLLSWNSFQDILYGHPITAALQALLNSFSHGYRNQGLLKRRADTLQFLKSDGIFLQPPNILQKGSNTLNAIPKIFFSALCPIGIRLGEIRIDVLNTAVVSHELLPATLLVTFVPALRSDHLDRLIRHGG